ncbi:MAG: dicarboxylate/amino acid:cation symporter [Myxococcales bacterium]|nr:dicarboxylate/amino acid:cation symporter [Myxococcales bacterium]
MTEATSPPAPGAGPGAGWRFWRWQLHSQVFLGLLLGAVVGLGLGLLAVERIPGDTEAAQRGVVGVKAVRGTMPFALIALVGEMFLNALFAITIPLITTSILLAVTRIGGNRDFGRLGAKTLGYYLITSLIAILTGLVLVNLFTPGLSHGVGILEGQDLSAFQGEQGEVARRVAGKELGDFLGIFRSMIPNNLFAAATEGNFVGLIVVSIVVGYFLARLVPERRRALETLVEAIYDLSLMVTHVILRLAPIGVACLIARTFAEQYATLWPDARFASFLAGIATFAAVAFAALMVHFLVTMPLVLRFVARVNPVRHYRAMAPALVTAFSTASSSATLPVTIDCVENRAGVSPRIAGFTLPIGATCNMDGTALYECVAAIFICQAFGVHLSFGQQAVVVMVALLTSVGVAGVPSASLVAIAIILRTVQAQLPDGPQPDLILGMGLLFVFDRPLDMVRTAVNMFGDSVGAVTIARSEGETSVLTPPPLT